ncbi:Histidine kinase [Sediminibacterium ginsengisoli]|uniref:Histidine kinase n=2 Tax=Sediminibacterium ginsengisoli TaxID=413434 RepID=A0A1T4QGY7_9BACT|nr:Histidine kinase [Sediminibacterium ginsengisoli]
MIFTGWWLVWILVQFYVVWSYGYSPAISITDSAVCNILLAGCCLLIVNNMKYYLPQHERYWYVLLISIVLSGTWLLAARTTLKIVFKNEYDYTVFLGSSLTLRYIFAFLMIACMAMISLLWYTLQEQQENQKRKEDAEKMAKDAELLKLRQQLQPHFLFNSLNSVSALAGSQPEKARHMIQQLSDFLRGTLKKEEHLPVTLEEEMHYLGLYLDIEKVRFGNRLQTAIVIDEEAGRLMIPALLLQPVVENAIKFGLYDTTGDVMISLHAEKKNDTLRITVTNPFDKTTAISTQGTGFGLASIERRLFLLFARTDLLRTTAGEQIFTTELTIPQYSL